MSSLIEKAIDKLEREIGARDEPLEQAAVARGRRQPVRDDAAPVEPIEAIEAIPLESPAARPLGPAGAPPPLLPVAQPIAPTHPTAKQHRLQSGEPPAAPAPAAVPQADDEPPVAAPPPKPTRGSAHYVEIDLRRLTEAGMITPQSSDTTISEQHRAIKRPLLLKAFPPEGKRTGNENVVLVTSSVPAEGKTFVSVNLAMSVAMEVDRTVLLVDGDPARSSVSRIFGITTERGLTDYLQSDDIELADVLVRTNVPNLTVLPAGRHVSNVTELFSSDQMARLTEELASRYSDRLIIIDSAPVLAASGTRVLAGLTGQIVFIVESVRTTQNTVREALHQLEPHPNVGLVLNKSRERPRASYQYGYYAPTQ